MAVRLFPTPLRIEALHWHRWLDRIGPSITGGTQEEGPSMVGTTQCRKNGEESSPCKVGPKKAVIRCYKDRVVYLYTHLKFNSEFTPEIRDREPIGKANVFQAPWLSGAKC